MQIKINALAVGTGGRTGHFSMDIFLRRVRAFAGGSGSDIR